MEPSGNYPFPPPNPANMTNPQPMNVHHDNTFARLVDQLNFSNMTIANLSQQMAEMRTEMQSLRADNTRLSDQIRITCTNPAPLVASTPNCSRGMRNRNADRNCGSPVLEDDRGFGDAGNGVGDGVENRNDHRDGAAGGDRRQSIEEQHLTVTEVESAFYEFSGTEMYSVEKWIADFDEMADCMGLTDLQRFVLAKKKLTGLANVSLGTVSHITGWKTLKQFLVKEFKKKENSAVIHETLRARKRKTGENVLEYFLVMREIGAKANLDMEAIITHTVNGINDNGPDKTLLYGARTMEDFREKLRIYQGLKDAKYGREGKQNIHPGEDSPSSCRSPRSRTSNYKFTNSRPGTSRSVVCYRCGTEGHIARDCPNDSHAAVNICRSSLVPVRESYLEAKVNSVPVKAIFDSGSVVSLLRADWSDKLGLMVNTKQTKRLTTLNGSVWTLGTCCVEMEVESIVLQIDFDVLEARDMPQLVLLGRNLLLHGDVKITANGTKFQQKNELFALTITVEDDVSEDLTHTRNPNIHEEVKGVVSSYSLYQQLPRRFKPLKKNIAEPLERSITCLSYTESSSARVLTQRKDTTDYEVGVPVPVRRTQRGTPLKIFPMIRGPYRVIRKRRNNGGVGIQEDWKTDYEVPDENGPSPSGSDGGQVGRLLG